MECYDKGIELAPENLIVYQLRGVFLKNQGNLSKAILDFEKCVELGETDEASLRHLAKLKALLADDSEEVKKIETIEKYLNDGQEYFHSAGDQNSFERAGEMFSKVLELAPMSGEAFFYRGLVNRNLGKDDLAIDDFSEAVKINSKDTDSYINMAEIWMERGNLEKALEDAQKGIKASDEDTFSGCDEIIQKIKALMALK